MSWTLSAQIEPGEDFDLKIAKAEVNGPNDPWITEQSRVAKEAAIDLIASGKLGDPSTFGFFVSLTGHANTGHAPSPGWVNDCVTISISQRTG